MKLAFLIHLHGSPFTIASATLSDPPPLTGLADAIVTTPLEWASSKMPDCHDDRRDEPSMSIVAWQETKAVDQTCPALPGHQNRTLVHPVMGSLALKSEPADSIPGPRLVRSDTENTEALQ